MGVRLEAVGAVAATQRPQPLGHPEDEKFQQKRKIKTGLAGWRYSAFCKTQYARAEYGIPNFIRCHLSVIHLLDRIAAIADDEGRD